MKKISKREANRIERRHAIVTIARDHFFEHGYAGTSMSAIAAALGGSKGTLWSYFRSKEELFAAVVDETATNIRSQLDVSGSGDDPLECLTRLCRSFIERGASPVVHAMMRLIIAEGHRQPEVSQIFFERGPGRTQHLVADFLRNNFADLLWTKDYLDAGKTLVALCMRGSFYEQLWGVAGPPPEAQMDADARKAAILFFRSYAHDPERFPLCEDLPQQDAAEMKPAA